MLREWVRLADAGQVFTALATLGLAAIAAGLVPLPPVRATEVSPCISLSGPAPVVQTPTTVTFAPGETTLFQPLNFMTPIPSSFAAVSVCVVDSGEQPVAVESEPTTLTLIAPAGYQPVVSAALDDPSQLATAFRGC